MRFRQLFAQATGGIARSLPTASLLRLTGQRLIAPFYHLVSDEKVPHIEHLYPVKTAREFAADLDFLLENFRPLDFFEFKKLALAGEQPARPSFFLSFDDGLREFHDVVAPILLQKGVSAMCFLNSDFIDNRGLFFRYKASLLAGHFQKEAVAVSHWRIHECS